MFLVAGCRCDGSAIAAATGNQKRLEDIKKCRRHKKLKY